MCKPQVMELYLLEKFQVSGTVKATRLDGNVFELSTGDPVFQGDTIETEGSGSVGLVFLDKTTLSLSDGGKMVLDELVYDPATGTGSMGINMVEGAFSFISGEIAKTGPDAMQIETPVVTMGIRGTTVAGKAAVEGNENAFTLLQDADGGVGQISVSNDGGTQSTITDRCYNNGFKFYSTTASTSYIKCGSDSSKLWGGIKCVTANASCSTYTTTSTSTTRATTRTTSTRRSL